jgi:hypothetical protein
VSAPDPRDAMWYGAEFAGFVQGFLKGWGVMVHPLGDDPDPNTMLRAAVVSWEDHLIRTRRSESGERRRGLEAVPR